MATLETLKEILCGTNGNGGILQDSSYYSGITDRINDAIESIAAGVRLPDGRTTPPLPDLYDMATVTTSITLPYVSLPSDYQRNVFMVADNAGEKIYPPKGGGYYAFALFLKQARRQDLAQAGTIDRVCVKGSKLYYHDIPSAAKTLTVHFYREPVAMSDDSDDVDGIPSHLQKRLVKHYVCREVFGEGLEDGENSRQVGYTYHTNRFYEACVELIDFIGIDAEPEFFDSDNEDYEY